MSKLFISYSRQDVDFVRRLATTLEGLGADLWLDIEDIPAGTKWSTAIQQGLKACDLMLLIISPESMESTNVEDEWQYYLDKKKPIIPILLRPAEIHFQLNRLQYVSFHERDYETALKQLYAELGKKEITLQTVPPPTIAIVKNLSKPAARPIIQSKFTLPLLEWINIPAGKVTLEGIDGTFDVEPFAIAKYPVTNAQFQAFIEDGYHNNRWWQFSEAARAWHKANPEPQPPSFTGDILPRETVCWYEAMAFTRWLGAKTNLPVTLPTEVQWQWVAVSDTGWDYPYGKGFDKTLYNTRESGIAKTTPVSYYDDKVLGKTKFGVMDMIGNVWEWCLNEYKSRESNFDSSARRSVRGGSWDDPQKYAYAAYRNHNYASFHSHIYGFRVCCEHSISR